MTPAEILAMSGEVVSELWPKWWVPGQPDVVGAAVYGGIVQEIPPPDLTEPANFVRALKEGPPVTLHRGKNTGTWLAGLGVAYSQWLQADTPELALLLALHALVRRRKEKG